MRLQETVVVTGILQYRLHQRRNFLYNNAFRKLIALDCKKKLVVTREGDRRNVGLTYTVVSVLNFALKTKIIPSQEFRRT
jgi:hypothetical protein